MTKIIENVVQLMFIQREKKTVFIRWDNFFYFNVIPKYVNISIKRFIIVWSTNNRKWITLYKKKSLWKKNSNVLKSNGTQPFWLRDVKNLTNEIVWKCLIFQFINASLWICDISTIITCFIRMFSNCWFQSNCSW